MKNLKKSWKVIALLSMGLIVILGYVEHLRAFTLIENQVSYILPYVFNSAVTGQVKVTNISDVNLTVSGEMVEDTGTVFQQFAAATVLPGQTATFHINKSTAALSLRPVMVISGGHNFNGAITELLVFNANAQIIELLPAVQFGI